MLEHLELVLLAVDETLDAGYILEMDATAIASRVLMRGNTDGLGGGSGTSTGSGTSSSTAGVTVGDLSLSQVTLLMLHWDGIVYWEW